MFGGDISFPTATPIEDTSYAALDEPTAGRRALVPFEESMLWDLPNYNGKIVGDGEPDSTNDSDSSKPVNKNIPENSVKNQLKGITRENVDPGNLGEFGKYIDWSKEGTTPTASNTWGGGYTYYADRAATMYTKTPQTARTSYLRPDFSTKGSREAYKRQDF